MTKQTIYVDASSLKSDGLCDRRYINHIFRGYTKDKQVANYKAAYGTAVHSALELYYAADSKDRHSSDLKKACLDKAIAKYEPSYLYAAPDDFRTPSHLARTVSGYINRYSIGDSLVPLKFNINGLEHSTLESKFCLPWYEDDNVIIYLTGTIDMPATYFDRPIIVDHKSTGSYKVEEFFAEFKMNIQTQLYVWVFRHMSKMKEYLPILINGIFIKKPTLKAEKEGRDFDGAHYERSSLIEYTESEMLQFDYWLHGRRAHIIALANIYKDEIKDYADLGPLNYAACHGRFSICPFYSICQLPSELQVDQLKSNFVKEQYNPLTWHD